MIYMIIQKVKSRLVECAGENNESKRYKRMKRQHNESVRRMGGRHIDRESEGRWVVTEWNTYRSYRVEKLRDSGCCDMICQRCNVCKHQFKCACTPLPFGAKGFCEHIHAVAMSCHPVSGNDDMVVGSGADVNSRSPILSELSMQPVDNENADNLGAALCLERLCRSDLPDLLGGLDESARETMIESLKTIAALKKWNSA